MIVVVDYGMGNLDSVARAFQRVEAEVQISSKPEVVASADKLVLPGVGSFEEGMANLQAYGLVEVLSQRVLADAVPILGICLGFQMFTEYGEEGGVAGLGWVEGQTKRFNVALKIPHIGWNNIVAKQDNQLLKAITADANFYFQHSYFVSCVEAAILASSEYGHEFVSAIQKNNIMGTQFHPEKSHANGLQLLRNFMEYD